MPSLSNDFLTAVRDGRPPEIDATEALMDQAVAEAIYESAEAGQAASLENVLSGKLTPTSVPSAHTQPSKIKQRPSGRLCSYNPDLAKSFQDYLSTKRRCSPIILYDSRNHPSISSSNSSAEVTLKW